MKVLKEENDIMNDWTWCKFIDYIIEHPNYILTIGSNSWKVKVNDNKISILYSSHSFKDYPIIKIIKNNNLCRVKFSSDNGEYKSYNYSLYDFINDSLKKLPIDYIFKPNLFFTSFYLSI